MTRPSAIRPSALCGVVTTARAAGGFDPIAPSTGCRWCSSTRSASAWRGPSGRDLDRWRLVAVAHMYLRKANDDLVSHCGCDKADALVSSPCQMDCPWCGCGWLFGCSRCRKAFTFAEAVEVDESWEQTGRRMIRTLYQREPGRTDLQEWIAFMKLLLKGV